MGYIDAVEWFEKNYPLPKGYKVDLIWVDYAYKVPEAQAAYDRFKTLGVVAVLSLGTGDTLALAPSAAQDKIPFISISLSAELLRKETPYNFFPQTDYSSQGRAMVQFVVEKWKEMHGGNPPRPPKLGLTYPNVPYGTSPIPAIKDMAKQLGVELCPDQIVDLAAIDATAQMLKLKECGADFVWAGGIAASVVVIMRDAKKVGLNAPILANVYGISEHHIKANPDAAEGNYWLTSLVPYYPDIEKGDPPGAKIIREFAKSKGRAPYTDLNTHYVAAWANINLLYKALREVIERGWEINGENIWKALTSIRDWDFSPLTGLTAENEEVSPARNCRGRRSGGSRSGLPVGAAAGSSSQWASPGAEGHQGWSYLRSDRRHFGRREALLLGSPRRDRMVREEQPAAQGLQGGPGMGRLQLQDP
jgi:branched-chain amino acid transport system substrate-binding protein